MKEIAINTSYIQLDQLLKYVGVIDSGGQIKPLINSEMIKLNSKIVNERRKKIFPDDIIEIKGYGVLKVIKV
jgi:ribosome-associated protein